MSFVPYTSSIRFGLPLGSPRESYLASMQAIFTPTGWKGDGSRPVVVIAMGSGSEWSTIFHPDLVTPIVRTILATGAAVACSPFGGDLYANPDARTAMTALVDYCTGPALGAAPKVGWFGFSMGGQSALVWSGQHPERSRFVVAAAPLVDVRSIDGAAGLEAAYPGGWTQAAHGATSNPATIADTGAYSGIPIALTYSSDDPVIPPSTVTSFAAASGATAVTVGALGHDWPIATHPATLAALTSMLEGS